MVAAVSDVGVCGLQIKGRTSVATASDKPDDEAAHNAAHAFPTRTDQHPDSDQDTAEADWHRWSAPALAPVPVNGVRCHCASVWVGNLYSFFTEPAACNGNLSAHLLMRLALLCGLVGNVKLIYNFPASHFNFSCCQHASCLLFHFAFCILHFQPPWLHSPCSNRSSAYQINFTIPWLDTSGHKYGVSYSRLLWLPALLNRIANCAHLQVECDFWFSVLYILIKTHESRNWYCNQIMNVGFCVIQTELNWVRFAETVLLTFL